jgi:hypothetical protein
MEWSSRRVFVQVQLVFRAVVLCRLRLANSGWNEGGIKSEEHFEAKILAISNKHVGADWPPTFELLPFLANISSGSIAFLPRLISGREDYLGNLETF